MSIDKATLRIIRSHLEEAAQIIDYANTDCERELEKCADALGEALEWLEESRKRHDNGLLLTNVKIHVTILL